MPTTVTSKENKQRAIDHFGFWQNPYPSQIHSNGPRGALKIFHGTPFWTAFGYPRPKHIIVRGSTLPLKEHVQCRDAAVRMAAVTQDRLRRRADGYWNLSNKQD
jgi:hypothetical protein